MSAVAEPARPPSIPPYDVAWETWPSAPTSPLLAPMGEDEVRLVARALKATGALPDMKTFTAGAAGIMLSELRHLGYQLARIPEHPPSRDRHVTPHFNKSGGCLCHCPLCVQVRLSEHTDHVDVDQLCVCVGCSEDCPSPGRLAHAKAAKL